MSVCLLSCAQPSIPILQPMMVISSVSMTTRRGIIRFESGRLTQEGTKLLLPHTHREALPRSGYVVIQPSIPLKSEELTHHKVSL